MSKHSCKPSGSGSGLALSKEALNPIDNLINALEIFERDMWWYGSHNLQAVREAYAKYKVSLLPDE